MILKIYQLGNDWNETKQMQYRMEDSGFFSLSVFNEF